jgi:hypothetical protein
MNSLIYSIPGGSQNNNELSDFYFHEFHGEWQFLLNNQDPLA